MEKTVCHSCGGNRIVWTFRASRTIRVICRTCNGTGKEKKFIQTHTMKRPTLDGRIYFGSY